MPYSKLHLVPILKGAVDPKKGIIFRTYYIRPERLQDMIKKLHETPTKSYIVRIPFLNEIEKAIRTNNILPLYDLVRRFPEGEQAWSVIQQHHKYTQISTHVAEQRQILIQSVYHYILTQDNTALAQTQKTLPNAAYTWKLLITATEKPIRPKLKRRKVKESVTVIRKEKDLQRILELVKQQEQKTSTTHTADYGVAVKYSKKLYKVSAGDIVGRQLSTLLNFTNSNPAKVKVITSRLVSKTTLRDKYGIVGNMILKPQMYKQEAEFWTELLMKIAYDIYNGELPVYNPEMLLFYIPILYSLNRKRCNLLIRATEDSIYTQQAVQLLQQQEVDPKTMPDLLVVAGICAQCIKLNSVEEWSDFLLGAAVAQLNTAHAYSFVSQKTELSAEEILRALFGELSWKWCLGQIVFSKVTNTHFIPYKEIAEYEGQDTYSLAIATKVLLPFLEKQKNELLTVTKQSRSKAIKALPNSTQITVYKPVPQDAQLIHLNPVEKLYTRPPETHALEITLDREALLAISEDESTLLVVEPIRHIRKVKEV